MCGKENEQGGDILWDSCRCRRSCCCNSFCAIPHESHGCFCVTSAVFHSLLHLLLTSLKSIFYKALRAQRAVRTNLAPSDLVPQDNSSFCLSHNNRPPQHLVEHPLRCAPFDGMHLATFFTCGQTTCLIFGDYKGKEGSVFSSLFLFLLRGALCFYLPTDLRLQPVSAASGSWTVNEAFTHTLFSYILYNQGEIKTAFHFQSIPVLFHISPFCICDVQ